jgi:threonine dehydrogenase-like Zn-dependent dehydrogenase
LAVGTAVFVGGVQADIPLPYSKIMLEELNIRGSFMYPRHVPGELYRMIAAGILDLTPIQTHTFSLDNVNEAFALG